MEKFKVYLNITEKPSIALGITQILSGGKYNTTKGLSKYNPVYDFNYEFNGDTVEMRITSVLGHLVGFRFSNSLSNWHTTSFDWLLTAPLEDYIQYFYYLFLKELAVIQGMEAVTKNIKSQAYEADCVIFWTDCDEDGESTI